MSEAEEDPYLGRVIAGRYRLSRCVGRGGMGAVYDAHHVQTDKRVAVKILAPRLSRDLKLITRFRREAMAASRLDHESCVAVYDFGEDTDGTFYITMEFVDGTGLGQEIKRNGPMSSERCVRVGIQLLSALDAAHAAGILHRDLKPQNIMLTRIAGRDDVVKVVDFGIAKFIDNSPEDQVALTIPGTIFGTPEYMSPEQARGEALDARSDVYSAAVVLWHCLLGRSPFRGKTVRETLMKVFSETPPSPVVERPGVVIPAGLIEALERALVKERGARTPDAATFLAELQRFAPSPQPLAPPPQFAPTPGILPDGSAPETLADDEHSDPRLARPRVATEVFRSSIEDSASDVDPSAATLHHGAPPDDDDAHDLPSAGEPPRATDVAPAPSHAPPSDRPLAEAVTAALPASTSTAIADDVAPTVAGLGATKRNSIFAFVGLIVTGALVGAVALLVSSGDDAVPPIDPPKVVVVDLAGPTPPGFVRDEAARDRALARAKELVAQATAHEGDEARTLEDDALVAYADAIRADPEHVPAHTGYVTLLVKHDRTREARRHIERAMALDEGARTHFKFTLMLIEAKERAAANSADAGTPR